MQRVCFCKTVSLFNHVLQPSQALALFYQSLLFSLKNVALIKWISFNVDIPTGLQLLMIDINGNVTIDDELLYKQLSNIKRDIEEQSDTTTILKWISRIVLRLASDCSVSSKTDRSLDFEAFNEFLKQFHTTSTDDRSTLSDDDEGISQDDLDNEDISRKAIHRALLKCIDYTTCYSLDNSSNTSEKQSNEIQDFENNSIALYNQQIIQILCSDTLELEIELARDFRQSSFESCLPPSSSLLPHDQTFYSIWSTLWRDVTQEYLQFNGQNRLRKISLDNTQHLNLSINENRRWSTRENDRVLDEIAQRQQSLRKTNQFNRLTPTDNLCLHDRLMSEIKQKRILRPIPMRNANLSTSFDSTRKRIRPVKELIESDLSSDDEERDEYGRKRVAVIDCLLESSPSSPEDNTDNETTIASKRLMKDSSNTLSLTFDEFCHIRNVITRAELETLLFDEKLYSEVAQGKLCFTCRKVYFNLLTFTFGIQCNVCKQKICRNCVTRIALPKDKLNDIPIHTFTPLTTSKNERSYSLDNKSPTTPMMTDVLNDYPFDENDSRRNSIPANIQNAKNPTELIDICTDCFFLLQQIRKKTRQHHINRSTSPSSTASLAALLIQTKANQELTNNNDPLQTLTTIGATGGSKKVSLSRRNLFLQLQPAYDVKFNNMKSGE